MLPSLPVSSSITAEDRAAAAIRAYCGWHVAPSLTETIILDGNGSGRMLLPSTKVTGVAEVAIDGVALDPAEYRWSADGWLTRAPRNRWPDTERSIAVTMTHGFDSVPEIEDVLPAVVARASLSLSGVELGESVGPFKQSFISGRDGIRTVGLMDAEKEILARYKLGTVPSV